MTTSIISYPSHSSNYNSMNPLVSKTDSSTEFYIPKRYILVFFAFMCTTISYTDRTNISFAIIDMTKEFNWSEVEKGFALSAFYIGYFLSNVPAGYFSHKYGGASVLAFASFFWCLFTLLTPLACYQSYSMLIVIRILLGFAEGFAFPCLHHLSSLWLPSSEHSFSVSFFTSGIFLGVIITDLISPIIIGYGSWSDVFYLFGGVGLLWTIAWTFWSTNRPEDMSGIKDEEINIINSEKIENEVIHQIPWVALLSSKQLWAFYLNMFASGWSFYVLLGNIKKSSFFKFNFSLDA